MAFFLQVTLQRNDTAGRVGAAGCRLTGWWRKVGINSRCQASAGAIKQHNVDGTPVPPAGGIDDFVDNVGRANYSWPWTNNTRGEGTTWPVTII